MFDGAPGAPRSVCGPLITWYNAPMEGAKAVLIIEDDADIANLVAINLRDIGLDADISADGADGASRALTGAPLMVLSSVMEGGANVISEAVAAGTPVLASAIPGNIGLLGADYPGYFPAQDTQALTALLDRVETDAAFLDTLRRHCAARAPLFDPARERQAWHDVLRQVTGAAQPVPTGRSVA